MDGMNDHALDHAGVAELLGAYALDAVEPAEAVAIEAHLAGCPRCRAELAGSREVAALLGDSGGPAPEGLWERLAASLEEAPPPLELGRLADLGAAREARADRAATRRRPPELRWMAGAAAAAAVVIGGLGVEVARLEHRTNDLMKQTRVATLQAAADAAASHTDARRATLLSSDGTLRLDAVVLPSGQAYVLDTNLPALPSGQTYQLWGLTGTVRVSLGTLGAKPGVEPFRVEPGMGALAVTAEHSPGATTSTKTPVVLATLPS